MVLYFGEVGHCFFFACPWGEVVLLWREGEGVYWFGGRGGFIGWGGGGGGGGKLPLHPHPLD